MYKKTLLLAALGLTTATTFAADSLKVLFVGNSYLGVNDVPQMVKNIANSTGKVLTYTAHTPGGSRLAQHNTDANVTNLINRGDWDVVVFQEQSQLPSFPDPDVQFNVYPAAEALSNKVYASNPCTKVMFYMTWGRQNGDRDNCGFFPPLCTYQGMDSLLRVRYTNMAEYNDAGISPVGPVWNYLRRTSSINLYSGDESHASVSGSYAAALTFYTMLFENDPTAVTFTPGGVNATDANTLRNATKLVSFDSMAYWNRFNASAGITAAYSQIADTANSMQYQFTNQTPNAVSYTWNFGDGSPVSNDPNPTHIYTNPGYYTVCLTVKNDCGTDEYCSNFEVKRQSTGINTLNPEQALTVFPNPAQQHLSINNIKDAFAYDITDATGRLIISTNDFKTHTKIDISSLQQGLYFLTIRNHAKATATLKFSKL